MLADLYGTTASALAGRFQMTGNLAANLDYTTTPHFGYNATRAIGDTVWNDLDNDGVQDAGEPGIGGVTVLLYRDVDLDGNFEPGAADGSAVASVVTTATGFYLFSGLNNGTYWVSIDNTQAALASYTSVDDAPTTTPRRRRASSAWCPWPARLAGWTSTTAIEPPRPTRSRGGCGTTPTRTASTTASRASGA